MMGSHLTCNNNIADNDTDIDIVNNKNNKCLLCDKSIYPKNDIYCYTHGVLNDYKISELFKKKKQKIVNNIFFNRTKKIRNILIIKPVLSSKS